MNYSIPSGITSTEKRKYLQQVSDVIAAHHKFLWNENDSSSNSVESKLAKEYHDKLFKEYCIGDLTNYRTNQIALRWRTKKEVISGKGELICGNKSCTETEDLKSWEVNFRYVEGGKTINALVKLRLCKECSVKLNYHKNKYKSHKKEITTESKSQATSDDEKLNKNKMDTSEDESKDDNLWSSEISQTSEMTIDQRIEVYLLDLF